MPIRVNAARIAVMRSAFADAAAEGVRDRVWTPSMIVALSGATSRRPSPPATMVAVMSRVGVCVCADAQPVTSTDASATAMEKRT
jgi:hypothetical protein